MATRKRVLVVCPGRGSYGRNSLGQLKGRNAAATRVVAACDAFRLAQGRTAISEIDGASAFRSKQHVAGEHASLLTFASSMADLAELDEGRYEVVGVTGNSLGFYTALAASGALSLDAAVRLVDTMGDFQTKNIVGGQLLYPLWDGDWKAQPELLAAIENGLRAAREAGGEAHWSIRLGGTAVLGADEVGLRVLEAALPRIKRGEREFPIRLPLHSAFHTSLMLGTSQRAFDELSDLPFTSPRFPLIDGCGFVHRPRWADPAAIRDYTLGAQVVETYDFSRALQSALNHCAPDLVVCLGPGNAMGGPVAQLLVNAGWRGVTGREDFMKVNASEPMLAAFGMPEQANDLKAS